MTHAASSSQWVEHLNHISPATRAACSSHAISPLVSKPFVDINRQAGSDTHQLLFCAGLSSPLLQFFLILVLSSWLAFPIYWLTTTCYFTIWKGRLRSDAICAFLLNVVLAGVVVPLAGGYSGRPLFVLLKVYSLIFALLFAWIFKFVRTPHRKLVSIACHGFLVENIVEAVVWEIYMIDQQPSNVLNALAGLLIAVAVPVFTFRYGVAIVDYEGGNAKRRLIQSNLSPLWIVAYTLWNVEYVAVYTADYGSFFTCCTLVTPMIMAFLGGEDWMESRATLLLYAITLRASPLGDSVVATVGLLENEFNSQGLQLALSALSLLAAIATCAELCFVLVKDAPWFRFNLPKCLCRVVEPEIKGGEWPREALGSSESGVYPLAKMNASHSGSAILEAPPARKIQ